MYWDDEGVEMADNGMVELDIPSEKKKCWVNLKLDLERDETIDLLVGDINILRNVCLTKKLNYNYHFHDGVGPLLVKILFFEAAIMKGRHLTRNTYFSINSDGTQQAIWRINIELGEKTNERLNKTFNLLNIMLMKRNNKTPS